MAKVTNMSGKAGKKTEKVRGVQKKQSPDTGKLDAFIVRLEEVKAELFELVQEQEDAGADRKSVEAMSEALDALEDAYDILCEVVNGEV